MKIEIVVVNVTHQRLENVNHDHSSLHPLQSILDEKDGIINNLGFHWKTKKVWGKKRAMIRLKLEADNWIIINIFCLSSISSFFNLILSIFFIKTVNVCIKQTFDVAREEISFHKIFNNL
jgi:hypothetical protein